MVTQEAKAIFTQIIGVIPSSVYPKVSQTLRNPLKLNNSVVNFNRRLIRNAPTFVFLL